MEKRKVYGYCRVGTKEQLDGMPDSSKSMNQEQPNTGEPEENENLVTEQEEDTETTFVPTM